MVSSRTATALVGLAASVLVSVAGWVYFDTLLFFLVVPFVPVLFRRRGEEPTAKRCPACGFETREASFSHCPRDGTPLT
jgi:hypothetical protein